MTDELAGQSVVVTGGSSGLGAATVRAFVAAGARVAFCHLGDQQGATAIAAESDAIFASECDVAEEAEVGRFLSEARRRHGPADCLVTCAGIGAAVPFAELSTAAWDRMIAVHLRGTFLCAKYVLPDMIERQRGRIIAVSSQLARLGDASLVHYCAAKAGILGLVRALAREGAPYGVLVNAVAPGTIETAMVAAHSAEWRRARSEAIPLHRFASPEEIVPSIMLLASTGGSFYSGQTLWPTGGEVMC
jgi:3-oxoacyl-[acyl-carrier protein] reductase